jgi:alpha-D-xyloside xylohydrolase
MMLEFSGDRACATLDSQYLLGSALLVAPVLTGSGAVKYYLPPGRWTHLLTGDVRSGGQWHRGRYDFLNLPLFVRPGSVVALGFTGARPDYDFNADLTFRVYELQDGSSLTCAVPTRDGAPGLRLTVNRIGRTICAVLEGKLSGRWHLQLAGVPAVTVRAPLRPVGDPLGVIVSAAEGSRQIDCQLSAALPPR